MAQIEAGIDCREVMLYLIGNQLWSVGFTVMGNSPEKGHPLQLVGMAMTLLLVVKQQITGRYPGFRIPVPGESRNLRTPIAGWFVGCDDHLGLGNRIPL